MTQPTLGRVVHYRVSAYDADRINKRRKDAYKSGAYGAATGHIVHVGNDVAEGQIFPAVIVRVWDEPEVTCNLKVLLDGNDDYWATSRKEGTDAAQWTWPEVK